MVCQGSIPSGVFIPHSVLHNDDLLTIIFQTFDAHAWPAEEREALAHAAVVCRAWSEPALMSLWGKGMCQYSSPLPLYHILLRKEQYKRPRDFPGDHTYISYKKTLNLVSTPLRILKNVCLHLDTAQIWPMEPAAMVSISSV